MNVHLGALDRRVWGTCYTLARSSRGPETPLPAAANPDNIPRLGFLLFLASLFLPTLHLRPGTTSTSSTFAWLPSHPHHPEHTCLKSLSQAQLLAGSQLDRERRGKWRGTVMSISLPGA